MIVLLHAYRKSFSALDVAIMFTLYEVAGAVTNLAAGETIRCAVLNCDFALTISCCSARLDGSKMGHSLHAHLRTVFANLFVWAFVWMERRLVEGNRDRLCVRRLGFNLRSHNLFVPLTQSAVPSRKCSQALQRTLQSWVGKP